MFNKKFKYCKEDMELAKKLYDAKLEKYREKN